MLTKNIPFGSALHTRILNAVTERRKFSAQKMDTYKKQWDDADDSMKAYIHERDVDKRRKHEKTYAGEIDFVTLEVPYTYAIIMTAHTYYSSVMLARQPVWQYTARHGETQDSVMAVEAVMDYQLRVGLHLPALYNWLYDLSKYTLGFIGAYWDEEEHIIAKYTEVPNMLAGVPIGGTTKQMQQEIVPGYAGNKLFNVRPHDFFPDPRVPLWKFQDGEFCIRKTSEGYHTLIAQEHQYPGYYCNLKEMVKAMKSRSSERDAGSSQVELPFQPGEGKAPGPGFISIDDAYIRLIPSLWGLSDSKRMEIWCFQVAESSVVISAKPLGHYHNMFPFAVVEGNYGSEEFAKSGMVEIIRPLTDVLTWLINSHFYNVRRIMNSQIIVDPSMLVMKDLTKPGQRVIRLKPQAYGRDIRGFVHQLAMVDATSQNLSNAQYIEQMIQRVSAVVDNVMGMQYQGGRKSATEARIASGASGNRLRTPVEYNSALGMSPLANMLLANTQQFMSNERKYAVAGNTLDHAQKFLTANPAAIAGFYDFVPVDGVMPIDRLAQANFWKELLMQMSRVPELMAQWDIGAMISHAMKLQGERNVDRFRIQVQPPVAPGAVNPLAQQAQAGNVIPLGGGRGPGAAGRGTGTAGGAI